MCIFKSKGYLLGPPSSILEEYGNQGCWICNAARVGSYSGWLYGAEHRSCIRPKWVALERGMALVEEGLGGGQGKLAERSSRMGAERGRERERVRSSSCFCWPGMSEG